MQIRRDKLPLSWYPKQATQFETPWCSGQVLVNQLTITSKGVVTDTFKDLVAGIFSLLPQTPIDAVGLNFFGHFKMANVDDYHRIGDCFAPKVIWDKIFDSSKFNTGLQDLTMRVLAGKRNEAPKNNSFRQITLQPSGQIRGGIFLQLNDNRDLLKPDQTDSKTAAERASEIVDRDWNNVRSEAEMLFDELLSSALSLKGTS